MRTHLQAFLESQGGIMLQLLTAVLLFGAACYFVRDYHDLFQLFSTAFSGLLGAYLAAIRFRTNAAASPAATTSSTISTTAESTISTTSTDPALNPPDEEKK